MSVDLMAHRELSMPELYRKIEIYSDRGNRIRAYEEGVLSQIKQEIRQACRQYKVDIPWWAEPDEGEHDEPVLDLGITEHLNMTKSLVEEGSLSAFQDLATEDPEPRTWVRAHHRSKPQPKAEEPPEVEAESTLDKSLRETEEEVSDAFRIW